MEWTEQSLRSLMSAVLLQAMSDLANKDFAIAHGAYRWLLEDGPLYVESLDMSFDIRAWTIERWYIRQHQGPRVVREKLVVEFRAARNSVREEVYGKV